MHSKWSTFSIFSLFAGLGLSALIPRYNAPTAKAGHVTYIGFTDATYGVDIWAGIRYAKPPLGPLRLQHPQPYEASGTIPSKEYGNRCFEIGKGVSPGSPTGNNSEDCLVLNIYTPSQASGGKRWLDARPPAGHVLPAWRGFQPGVWK